MNQSKKENIKPKSTCRINTQELCNSLKSSKLQVTVMKGEGEGGIEEET